MRPSWEQIQATAYQRWERRGGGDGLDREDWVAAEKDLNFALNYRYIARYRLAGDAVFLGKPEGQARRRRCRFCEQAYPAVSFTEGLLALPPIVGNTAILAWDECDECRAAYEASLAGPFEAFARPLMAPTPTWPREGACVPAPALKALVRMALALLPESELQHFGDTAEWVTNPDHGRDAALLGDLGCQVYRTPAPITAPFATLARRVADAPYPYMLFFLGASRVVLQTHLPLCPLDEDLEDAGLRGPELSMSLGEGPEHRASLSVYLPVATGWQVPPNPVAEVSPPAFEPIPAGDPVSSQPAE